MTGHLIHIGYAKAASTLLQKWFAEHPQLGFSPWSIGGYRDVRAVVAAAAMAEPADIRYRITSSEALCAPFARNSNGGLDFEATSPTLAVRQGEACRLLAELFPHAKILIITRGFRSMILSSYSQYVRSGGAADLEGLIDASQADSPWHYDRMIGIYQKAFGQDRVLALPWELLRDDGAAFGNAIEAWLGIDHHPLPDEVSNRALSSVELRWYPRFRRWAGKLPVGAKIQRRLLMRLAWLGRRNRLRVPIRLLQRLFPAPVVNSALISEATLERFRGQADQLAGDPRYSPYAREYLFP